MGIMVYSLLWVMQDLFRQPYGYGVIAWKLRLSLTYTQRSLSSRTVCSSPIPSANFAAQTLYRTLVISKPYTVNSIKLKPRIFTP